MTRFEEEIGEFRLLITASRNWTDQLRIWTQLSWWLGEYGAALKIIHGACKTGGDKIASQWCVDHDVDEERYPAKWKRHGRPAAGPMRNKIMVNRGADACLAFPLYGSKGTLGCAALALDAFIPVINCGPVEIPGVDGVNQNSWEEWSRE